jgi:hypothetical protein
MARSGVAFRLLGAVIEGSFYETAAFITLSLVLQAGLAFRYISPTLAAWETQDTYMMMGLLCVLSYLIIPAITHLILISNIVSNGNSAVESQYISKIRKLSDDSLRWMTMLLTSLFLATVTKVAFPVRFELLTASALAIIGSVICRLVGASLLEFYFVACFRQSAVSLVGYAVVPNFDASFGHLIRRSAHFAQSRILSIKDFLF